MNYIDDISSMVSMTTIAESPVLNRRRKAASRCLFGAPDSEKLTEQLTAELKSICDRDRKKWNYDFEKDVPVIHGQGDYEFEPIDASNIPMFYHPKKINKLTPECIFNQRIHLDDFCQASEASSSSSLVSMKEMECEKYEKPVTRSATRNISDSDDKGLKQAKLTNYMPVRKRKLENNIPSIYRSASAEVLSPTDKNSMKKIIPVRRNNTGAPNRPKKFVPHSYGNDKLSSKSDTTLVTSPLSPPMKRCVRRSQRFVIAGDA